MLLVKDAEKLKKKLQDELLMDLSQRAVGANERRSRAPTQEDRSRSLHWIPHLDLKPLALSPSGSIKAFKAESRRRPGADPGILS